MSPDAAPSAALSIADLRAYCDKTAAMLRRRGYTLIHGGDFDRADTLPPGDLKNRVLKQLALAEMSFEAILLERRLHGPIEKAVRVADGGLIRF